MNKIKLDVSSWKIKLDERSRGRMKVAIKLSKDEAEGFKNWSSVVRPDNITDEEFFKQIFFNGIEFLNVKLQQVAKQVLDDPEMRKNLELSGINVSAFREEYQMNYLPRNINSWDRLQNLIRYVHDRTEEGSLSPVKVLFYSPWNPASTKIKGYDCKVNIFEVPEAFHVLMDSFSFEDVKINYVPTLVTLYSLQTSEGPTVAVRINDNPTAIHYELGV